MANMTQSLKLENITKSFPGVKAIENVTLEAYPGEILALAGENGAGKSTLMNVLSGALLADSGRILLDGRPLERLSRAADCPYVAVSMPSAATLDEGASPGLL